jgi:hypothetical protein
MTSTAPPPTIQQPAGAQAPPTVQGLPPTGLQQQLATINANHANAAAQGIHSNPQAANQALPASVTGGGTGAPGSPTTQRGSTSLSQLANTLATSYGLSLPRGDIVDSQGNFLVTPDQLAAASGGKESMGTAAAKMNYIADAIQRQQQQAELQKSEAALATGAGLVGKRGRGSLAQLQEGTYNNIAQLYQSQQHKAADFSYFIEKEKLDLAAQIQERQRKLERNKARGQFVTGLGLGVAGALSGNWTAATAGAAQAGGSAGGTGWF